MAKHVDNSAHLHPGSPGLGDAPVTIAERVFEAIQKSIVEGDIPPGGKISEPELARAYGVSRSSLREAIGRLEARNLVVRRPNRGARVVTLTLEKLLELYHVREALEGVACRLAAERMGPPEVAELRALLVQHRQEAERHEGKAYYQQEGDLDFHYRIVQGSGNGKLIDLFCNDLYQLVRMYRYQLGMASPRARRAFSEHELIVDAIEEQDGELAELLMRRHIRASRHNVERRLQAQSARTEAAPAVAAGDRRRPRRRTTSGPPSIER